MSDGYSVELPRLLEVANTCLPTVDGNLAAAENALYAVENDETFAFDIVGSNGGFLSGLNYGVDVEGLYRDVHASFTNVREELLTVVRELRTNLETSEEALVRIHDRYAAADGQ
jgi:hypothetical protein